MFHDSSRTTGGPGSYVASCAGGFVLALGLFEAQRDFAENNSSSSRVLFSLYRRCSYSLRFGPGASATTSELGHRAPMPVRRSHGICLVSRWSRLRDEPTHQLYEQASAVVQQPVHGVSHEPELFIEGLRTGPGSDALLHLKASDSIRGKYSGAPHIPPGQTCLECSVLCSLASFYPSNLFALLFLSLAVFVASCLVCLWVPLVFGLVFGLVALCLCGLVVLWPCGLVALCPCGFMAW